MKELCEESKQGAGTGHTSAGKAGSSWNTDPTFEGGFISTRKGGSKGAIYMEVPCGEQWWA